ncbi:ECF transporter S component [Sutcliffiella cohnii]|uniref:ECF transporter S component n=1 Tax=Sutcliffiella cohnii TaxID=33932 RepID=UPI002E20C7F0|nr:ECF transporter S component [Sutcliffiella cohnii]MED4017669.1 ECF transporter S component [Sutcliffiella cohnii]
MANTNKVLYVGSILVTCFVLAVVLWSEKYYLPLSFIMIGLAMLPFFVRFENREIKAEEVVLIAMLASIAAVSRVPFASLPSVQPTSFVIMMAGLVFGAEVGLLVGSIAAIVSNIFLGQGPWTPWQMFSWGMIGFTAGLLRNTVFLKSFWGKNVFGFVWGFLFGWIMNLWFVLGFFEELSWKVFASAYIASFYFDLAHALSNVFFITIFSAVWLKILHRVKIKYGVL